MVLSIATGGGGGGGDGGGGGSGGGGGGGTLIVRSLRTCFIDSGANGIACIPCQRAVPVPVVPPIQPIGSVHPQFVRGKVVKVSRKHLRTEVTTLI